MSNKAVPFLDYSLKHLHVVVSNNMTRPKQGEPFYAGLIYSPDKVFAKINENSERHFQEFFGQPGTFTLTAMQTEMGPGELALKLEKRFGAYCPSHIGGIIAEIRIPRDRLAALFAELMEKPQLYRESAEKKLYA